MLQKCWMAGHRCGFGECKCHCKECLNKPAIISENVSTNQEISEIVQAEDHNNVADWGYWTSPDHKNAAIDNSYKPNDIVTSNTYSVADVNAILIDYKYFESFTGTDPENRETQSSKFMPKHAKCYQNVSNHNSYLLVWDISHSHQQLESLSNEELEKLQEYHINLDVSIPSVICAQRPSIVSTTSSQMTSPPLVTDVVCPDPNTKTSSDDDITSFNFDFYNYYSLETMNLTNDEDIMKVIHKKFFNCDSGLSSIKIGTHPKHRDKNAHIDSS